MLFAEKYLGYPLDLSTFPVKQDFDPTNLEEVTTKILNWEKNLIYSEKFKQYVLEILIKLVLEIEEGFDYRNELNQEEDKCVSWALCLISEDFYVSNNILHAGEKEEYEKIYTWLSIEIPLQDPDSQKWKIEIFGALAPEYGDVPFAKLTMSEIKEAETINWEQTFNFQ